MCLRCVCTNVCLSIFTNAVQFPQSGHDDAALVSELVGRYIEAFECIPFPRVPHRPTSSIKLLNLLLSSKFVKDRDDKVCSLLRLILSEMSRVSVDMKVLLLSCLSRHSSSSVSYRLVLSRLMNDLNPLITMVRCAGSSTKMPTHKHQYYFCLANRCFKWLLFS